MDSYLDNISDDEVFIGEISLKEVKKRIFLNSSNDCSSLPDFNQIKEHNENNESIQIIETKSEPNISVRTLTTGSRCSVGSVNSSNWEIKSIDDSFLRLEKMVSDLCVSPKSNHDLDNTLEIVDYILKNPVTNDYINNVDDCKSPIGNESMKKEYTTPLSKVNEYCQINKAEKCNKLKETQNNKMSESTNKNCETPSTPVTKKNDHIFQTPKNLPSSNKPSLTNSHKKIPNSVNIYKHIASPVAFYIKKCPQVPLIRDVHLKKPLNSCTSIPKAIKSTLGNKASNKDYISLPSVAYKCAKKTQLISVPDTEKLPSSQWVKKLNNSLPKPVVIKHGQRQVNCNSNVSTSKNEESFVNLPLKQADVSVCMKKCAYSKNT